MITSFKIFEKVEDDKDVFLEYWRVPTSSPKLEIALKKLNKISCDIKKDDIKLNSNKKYIYIVRKTVFEEPFIFYTDWFITDLHVIKSYNNVEYKSYINVSKSDIQEYNMRQTASKYNI